MSQSKKKKIRKLRKSHVLPSIILFLASILISAIAMMFCIGFIIGFTTSEKLNNSADEILRMSRIISGASAYEDEQSIISNMISYADFPETICITDNAGNVLTACGDVSFDK